MDYTVEDLKAKKVGELRDIARDIEHDSLQGYSSMRKEDLIEALSVAMGGAPTPARPARKRKPASGSGAPKLAVRRIPTAGLDRSGIKNLIRGLKSDRAGATGTADAGRLRVIRRQIHRLKRQARVAPKAEPPAAAPQE